MRALMEQLNRDAERLARAFELRYRSIEAERPSVKRRYGVCYADGRIRIRLRHAVTGLPLKYSSLVNTLCHELAHLRHFDHGERFKAFYLDLLEHARAQGIYRPGRPSRAGGVAPTRITPAAPVVDRTPGQLSLFGWIATGAAAIGRRGGGEGAGR